MLSISSLNKLYSMETPTPARFKDKDPLTDDWEGKKFIGKMAAIVCHEITSGKLERNCSSPAMEEAVKDLFRYFDDRSHILPQDRVMLISDMMTTLTCRAVRFAQIEAYELAAEASRRRSGTKSD
jgi:hypothetical protein